MSQIKIDKRNKLSYPWTVQIRQAEYNRDPLPSTQVHPPESKETGVAEYYKTSTSQPSFISSSSTQHSSKAATSKTPHGTQLSKWLCTAPSTAPHGGTGATTGRRRRGGGTRSPESAGHQRIQRAPAHLHNSTMQNQGHDGIWIYDSSENSSDKFIMMLTLVLGNMELTFRENVDRAQHINCTQCNLQVQISQNIRFTYGLVSHIHCIGRWYETADRNSTACLLSQS